MLELLQVLVQKYIPQTGRPTVLRIRVFTPDPGFEFFPSRIPDPNFFHLGSRIRIFFYPGSQKSQNSRHQCFSYYLFLMTKESGPGAGSGSLTNVQDTDPGGPKIYGFYGSGSAKLLPPHVEIHTSRAIKSIFILF